MADQRYQDDRKGEEQNHVAVRERISARGGKWDRQRRGERDDPANTGEGEDEGRTARAGRDPCVGSREKQTRQIGSGVHPDEAGDDDHSADDGGGDGQFGDADGGSCGRYQRARLQAGDEEHHAFDKINEEIPEEDALETGFGADQPEAVPTDVESGGDGGEHARAAEMFGWPIGQKRRQDREDDFDARIARPIGAGAASASPRQSPR